MWHWRRAQGALNIFHQKRRATAGGQTLPGGFGGILAATLKRTKWIYIWYMLILYMIYDIYISCILYIIYMYIWDIYICVLYPQLYIYMEYPHSNIYVWHIHLIVIWYRQTRYWAFAFDPQKGAGRTADEMRHVGKRSDGDEGSEDVRDRYLIR
jgi:hypothetical protein